ncbi:MAG: T9SS type A sorting domain-containing protein [Bacteroidota bacterium]
MFGKILINILFLFFSINISAQQSGFEIIFDSEMDEEAIDFKRKGVDGFVGLINIASIIDTNVIYYSYLYEIDNFGDTNSVKFEKSDTTFRYFYLDRVLTDPKGFILSGLGRGLYPPDNDLFTIITRIDNNNNIIWEKTFKFNYSFGAYRASILELINGDLLYACSPNLNENMFLLRLSPQGDSLYYTSYNGSESGEVWDLTYNHDSSNILLSTKWAHYETGGFVSSIITLDDSLNQINVNYYPEHFNPPYNTLWYDNDKLLVGGRDQIIQFSGNTEKMISAYLLDTSFNILNEVHLTHPDTNSRGAEVQAIDYYYTNSVFLGGTHNQQGLFGNEPNWFYISKLNDTLGVEFEKYIGGDNLYWLYSVTASSDGGVLLVGNYKDIDQTTLNRNVFILKMDSIGCITSNLESPVVPINEAVIYPNPGMDNIFVRTSLKDCIFILYDSFGKVIISTNLENRVTKLKVDYLSPGEYFYSVINKNQKVLTGTWIKTKI